MKGWSLVFSVQMAGLPTDTRELLDKHINNHGLSVRLNDGILIEFSKKKSQFKDKKGLYSFTIRGTQEVSFYSMLDTLSPSPFHISPFSPLFFFLSFSFSPFLFVPLFVHFLSASFFSLSPSFSFVSLSYFLTFSFLLFSFFF